jgi:RNA polymerase sigma factor (sigma-70 family)
MSRVTCHPRRDHGTSVLAMLRFAVLEVPAPIALTATFGAIAGTETVESDARALVIRLFHEQGRSLVRLARLFVDDRDAAEDIVQEAFLRLARNTHHIEHESKAPAYLRSIVLNLARDHNRRGMVSLRHHATAGRELDVDETPIEDELVRSENHRAVLDAVRSLPARQRDCITLRYFEDLGIEAIAATLGLSANSVKTHLKRAMASLGRVLEVKP